VNSFFLGERKNVIILGLINQRVNKSFWSSRLLCEYRRLSLDIHELRSPSRLNSCATPVQHVYAPNVPNNEKEQNRLPQLCRRHTALSISMNIYLGILAEIDLECTINVTIQHITLIQDCTIIVLKSQLHQCASSFICI